MDDCRLHTRDTQHGTPAPVRIPERRDCLPVDGEGCGDWHRAARLPGPTGRHLHATPAELAAAGGDLSLIVLTYWNGSTWVALTGTQNANGTITYTLPHASLFGILIRPAGAVPIQIDLPDGRFFTAANGFGGAGGTGFAVTDGGGIGFWSEFQRMGGVDRIGYPISGRFMHGGFVTQAFQKLALQWRPDLVQAVPVNVLDDLHVHGSDSWLNTAQRILHRPQLAGDVRTAGPREGLRPDGRRATAAGNLAVVGGGHALGSGRYRRGRQRW